MLNEKTEKIGYELKNDALDDDDKKLFFYSTDEYGNKYLILNPNQNLKKLEYREIMYYPPTFYEILEDDDILKTINLIKVEDNIVSRSEYYNYLAKKYDLKFELSGERKKSNIFEEWENISVNGFHEKYLLSEEEKMILHELRRNKEEQEKIKKKR